jgi:hypothetical protein
MRDFYYRVGPVETTTPWNRPDYYSMKAFFNDVLNSPIGKKYDVYLYGGVLQDLPTWDIDISLNGEIDYIKSFERDLAEMYDLALNKHSLLIDTSWMNRNLMKDKYEDAKIRNFIHPDSNAPRQTVKFFETRKEDRRGENIVESTQNLRQMRKGDVDGNLISFTYPPLYGKKVVDKYQNFEYILKEPMKVKDFVFNNRSWYEMNR